MFDKLKFWKGEEFSETPNFGSSDPMPRNPDPLAQGPDPFAQAQGDPLQRQELFGQDVSQDPLPAPQGQYPQTGSLSGARLARQYATQHEVPQQYEEVVPQGRDRDTELILAKLDAIKSEIDSLHQRVRKIEQHTDQQKRAW